MYNVKEVLKDKKIFFYVTKKMFESLDSDGSGNLSEDELWIVMCSLADDFGFKRPSFDETQQITKIVDIDHSGTVDIWEFRILIRKILLAVLQEHESHYMDIKKTSLEPMEDPVVE